MASLWLNCWPTDRLRLRRALAPDLPFVTVATVGSRRLILAADPAAMLAGITPGMTLADARARLPAVRAFEADPAGDAEALARLADWCTRFSPWTATAGQDSIWLDVTGSVPLFPSEEALLEELLGRLRQQGFSCRAVIADTPGCAWAVSRHGAADLAVVPQGQGRAALAPLPVAGLRLSEEILHDLQRLGLKQIGSLYGLPRAPLAPRFGETVALRLDQAMGLVEEPISPRHPVEPRAERQGFAEPILTPESLHQGMGTLVRKLCRRLEREGMGVRRLELACYRVDAQVERVAIGTSQPSRDPDHLIRLMAPRIEEIDPGLGIELMLLRALEVERQHAVQLGLDAPTGAAAEGAVAALIDRLANRLGAENVVRLVPYGSHVPERAVRTVPAFETLKPAVGPAGRPRPIRLLACPAPVEVTALVPDYPPVQFRWRRVLHHVRRAEGPERIAAEWWRSFDTDPNDFDRDIRDYYRVEDQDGRRFWLYRESLYRPDERPRWFLHGLFA